MKHTFFVITCSVLCSITLLSCSSFIEKEKADELKKYEKSKYIMKKDVRIGSLKLKKGERVRILLSVSDDWIKVYGYRASTPVLKAERVLILYLFEDDFSEETFDQKVFDKELYSIIRKIK